MDNFQGLFADDDLHHLDLNEESFQPAPGPTPGSTNTPNVDIGTYPQQVSYAGIGSSPQHGLPQPPASGAKLTMVVRPPQNQAPMAGYATGPPQGYEFTNSTPGQQFPGGQYRQPFPGGGQEMFNQRPQIQGAPQQMTWTGGGEGFHQQPQGTPNYRPQQPQQQPPPQPSSQVQYSISNSQPGINSYPSQTMGGTLTQTYQQVPQSGMVQSFPQGAAGIYQNTPRSPYHPGFDAQRPLGPNSPGINNYPPGSPSGSHGPAIIGSGQQPQQFSQSSQSQFPVMQNPREQFQMAQFNSQGQMIRQQLHHGGPQGEPQGAPFSGQLMPNGTSYRTPFPQHSPHQSPRPQLSPHPHPRSMSPHPRPTSGNLSMTAPISSPSVITSTSSGSPNPIVGSSLQNLESMVTSPNSPSATPTQSLHSPGMYVNSTGIQNSPLGVRAPMSPGMNNRAPGPNPMSPGVANIAQVSSNSIPPNLSNYPSSLPVTNPMVNIAHGTRPMSPRLSSTNIGGQGIGPQMSPQQWGQPRQGVHQYHPHQVYISGGVNIIRGQTPTGPTSNVVSSQDSSLVSNSISSISDNNSVNSNVMSTSNISSLSNVNNFVNVSANSSGINESTVSTTTQVVSTSGLSNSPSDNEMVSISQSVGKPENDSIQNNIGMSGVIENGISTPGNIVSSPQVPSNVGNTVVRFITGPGQGGPRPYVQQGYRVMGPRGFAPGVQMIQHVPGGPRSQFSSSQVMVSGADSPQGISSLITGPQETMGTNQVPPISQCQNQPIEGTQIGKIESSSSAVRMIPPSMATSVQMSASGPQSTLINQAPGAHRLPNPIGGVNGPRGAMPRPVKRSGGRAAGRGLRAGNVGPRGKITIQMTPNLPPNAITVPMQGPITGTIIQNGPNNPTLQSGIHISPGQQLPSGMPHIPGNHMVNHQNMAPTIAPAVVVTQTGTSVTQPGGTIVGQPANQIGQYISQADQSMNQVGSPVSQSISQPVNQVGQPVNPADSPIKQVGSPIQQPQLNLSIEIQQSQGRLTQLYKLPQNVTIQKQINELQIRIQHLQQQQQKQHQHFIQNQALYTQTAPGGEIGAKTPSKAKAPAKPKTPKAPKSPKTPKPKKEVKPKEPKEAKPKKEPKPKTPRAPRPPKEPKTPKEPKPKSERPISTITGLPKRPYVRKKPLPVPGSTTVTLEGAAAAEKALDVATLGNVYPPDSLDGSIPSVVNSDNTVSTTVPTAESKETEESNKDEELEPGEVRFDPVTGDPIHPAPIPVTVVAPPKPKPEKKPKVKSTTPGRKRPSAKLNLNFKKKKKRRGSESDFSDAGEGNADGTPKEEDANSRRSGRNQGSRKKYVDELVLNLSEEEGDDALRQEEENSANGPVKPNFVYVDPNVEDGMAVQQILQMRMGEREIVSDDDEEEQEGPQLPKPKGPPRKIALEEFYVKYKAFSYKHCEWRTEEELLKGDKRIQGKIKRYKQKRNLNMGIMDFCSEDAFNPDYIEVDRILDRNEVKDEESGNVTSVHYLIKWKSLPYEDSTWEVEDDVEADKVEEYNKFCKPPPKSEWNLKKRPKKEEWKQLDESPVYKNNNQLREYQLEGLNWLTFSYYRGHNCILADEMGLGKTIQSLTMIDSIHKYGIRGPFLVIAPLSTIPNWQREFEGWTDLNVIVYHGSQASRNMILEYDMYYKDENDGRIADIYKFHVLITTFEVIIADCVELKEINWICCVIDEAHRLKNRNCKLLEGLRMMSLEHRVLLSGTPLQNNVNELFSLLNFLEPAQFSCQENFLAEFGKLQSEEQVKKLQALLKPMMLRRMKEDVEKALAPKQETIIEVELTNIQKKYYRAILERNFDFLVKGATYTNVPSLMNTMMELRKCCLHPYLLNGAEESIQQDYKKGMKSDATANDVYHQTLVQSSGKMVLVDKLLPKLKEDGHRVLVFSQMVKLLDIIEDYLINRKYPYERLDGRIRGNLRQAAIDRFCKPDSDRFVFLLCTKAGGLGINLTAADTVIIYDSDWNPQNDLQAQARCHRIGQEKNVKIYRLLCRNTYEREMFDKASLKLGLDKAVLQSLNTEVTTAAGGNSLGLSKKEVEDLLKKGAYGALMEDDNQGDKFCEEDIDQIMSRRTTVVTLESEKGSTFAKASFSMSNNRSDIDIDDVDFWKKWAKKAEIELDEDEKLRKKVLIVEEPRRRSQIRRYGHDEAAVDCSDLESSDSEVAPDDNNEDEITLSSDLRLRSRSSRRNRGSRGRYMTKNSRGGSRQTRLSRFAFEEEILDGDRVKYGSWLRSDCFKVEKGLLTYGWGRWKEIHQHGEFRNTWKFKEVQDCARMILLFCIQYYKGDDKIKGFIFDLIAPTEDGVTKVHKNHIGLSAPVPRGKKKLREAKLIASHMEGAEWSKEERFDTDVYLDQGYSRHLTRHANKVLLRVRLLFYIKQEIIGDLADKIMAENARYTDVPIHPPPTELCPKPWWDLDADRSLIMGVYKHGYERYSVVRNDPSLCFLERCGPPDKAALQAEMSLNVNEDEMEEKDDNDDEKEEKDDSDSNLTTPNSPAVSVSTNKSDEDKSKDGIIKDKDSIASDETRELLPYPTASDLNGRLRRMVTSYQRNNKKIEMRKEANVRVRPGFDHYLADKLMRRERMAEYIRERELRKADYNQRRWSNREQAEFYRTISTFGVEYIRKEKRYDWSKFRMLSRLEKRMDENLTEYFRAFMAMCKRQCGIRLSEQENAKILEVGVDRLPEERARRVLERVDLLNRLRNDVLPHPELAKALHLALPCKDLPEWWIPGKHDLDLLKGVARHGLGRTDYYILYDPDLCFREILRRHTAGEPLITKEEKLKIRRRFYPDEEIEEEVDVNEKEDNDESKIKSEKSSEDEKSEETKSIKADAESIEGNQDNVKSEEEKEEKMDVDEKPSSEENDSKDNAETKSDMKVEVKEESDANPKVEVKDEDEQKETREDGEMSSEVDDEDSTVTKETSADEVSVKKIEGEKEKSEGSESVKADKMEDGDEKPQVKTDKPVADAPLLSLQQMDEAIAKFDNGVNVDSLAANEPTIAQLLAQSAANPIKWSKDRHLQTRLEHIMYAVEHKKWPVDLNFQGSDVDPIMLKSETPPPVTPAHEILLMEEQHKHMRRVEAEVERAHLQALLHPNLHHNLGLPKASAAAALGLPSFSQANLRSFLEANEEKKAMSESHSHALRQLQALQGSLNLTIKPVTSNQMDMAQSFLPRRGPGRPRMDESARRSSHSGSPVDKRRLCESPHDKQPPLQDKKRRKLDDIVFGLAKKDDGIKEHLNSLSTILLKGSSPSSLSLSSLKDAGGSHSPMSTKLSSSISITPTSGLKVIQDRPESSSPGKSSTKSSSCPIEKEESKSSKPGLVKTSDLPPGISLPPGIELYRPTDVAKVDKWLEQHQGLMGDSPPGIKNESREASRGTREAKRRKVDFSNFDWSQFSGDEHVPVVCTQTGQKIGGKDAPKLKHLAQWLIEHHGFDVDPHWAESHCNSTKSIRAPSTPSPVSSESRRERKLPSSTPFSRHYSPSSITTSPSWSTTAVSSALGTTPTSSNLYQGRRGDQRSLLHASLDQKNPLALAALAGIDPKLLLGGIDPKLLSQLSLDPKILQAMGIDPKLFGIELGKQEQHPSHKKDKSASPSPSTSNRSDSPKGGLALDHKALQSLGLDPKLLAGLDPKTLLAMDPKLLGFDPKILITGLDSPSPKPSTSTPELKSSTSEPKPQLSTDFRLPGIDPKVLASLGVDPKALAKLDPSVLIGMGIDPKLLGVETKQHSTSEANQPSTSMGAIDPKMFGLDLKQLSSLDPKLIANMPIDPRLLLGLDPKQFSGNDPKLLATMGMDPKVLSNIGLDPKLLANMGLDPKQLAGLDPKLLSSMGLDPKQLSNLDPKLLASMGLDPKQFAGLDPKLLANMGLDPKQLAGLDPNLLATMGLDPKQLAGLDPKLLANMGLDLKSLAGLDPKVLASMGLDPKSLSGLDPKLLASMGIDPKQLANLDPKLLSNLGLDPAQLQGLDPKLLSSMGLDPKHLQGMDPKILASMGLDPKHMQNLLLDPKLAGFDPKLLQGLDPKQLAAMDPRHLTSMMNMDLKQSSIDPKLLTGLDPKTLANIDPKVLASMGIDPMMLMGGFGNLPGLASLGMNPLMAGLGGFGIPKASTSKSKDRNTSTTLAASSQAQANLLSGMFAASGGAGMMCPPLSLGSMGGQFQLPSISAAGLLNGLQGVSVSQTHQSSPVSRASPTQRRQIEIRKQETTDRERAERHQRDAQSKSSIAGALSREEKSILKQMNAERAAARGGERIQEVGQDLSLSRSRPSSVGNASISSVSDVPENLSKSQPDEEDRMSESCYPPEEEDEPPDDQEGDGESSAAEEEDDG